MGDVEEGIRIVKDGAKEYYVMSEVGADNVVYSTFASSLSDTMATAENDNYETFRKLLESAGVKFTGKERSLEIIGIPYSSLNHDSKGNLLDPIKQRHLGAEIFLDEYGTHKSIRERMQGENEISQNSSVYFKGNVGLRDARIDGALRIEAKDGVSIQVTGDFDNAGYEVEPLSKVQIVNALKNALAEKARNKAIIRAEAAARAPDTTKLTLMRPGIFSRSFARYRP